MPAILLTIALGLAAGYLDLVLVICKKYWWSDLGHFESARDFTWSIPVAHVILLLIPGLLLAAMTRVRPRGLSVPTGTWLLLTLALWMALLRAPLYGAAVLILAAGLARPISGAIANSIVRRPRRAWRLLAGLVAGVIVLAVLPSGRHAVAERLAVGGLPPAAPSARNVVLIVWDTVRASSMSLYTKIIRSRPCRSWAALFPETGSSKTSSVPATSTSRNGSASNPAMRAG